MAIQTGNPIGLLLALTYTVLSSADDCVSKDITATSSVSAPTITQIQALVSKNIASASEVSKPVIGQLQVLVSKNIESASSVSIPSITQAHALVSKTIISLAIIDMATCNSGMRITINMEAQMQNLDGGMRG